MTHSTIVHAIVLSMFSILVGCGRIPETQETQTLPPVAAPPQQRIEFETKTDTVTMEHSGSIAAAGNEARDIQIRYMVQIGAFKNPHNASAVQAIARERYHLPVLNDFNTAFTLYQIRIGFFETKEDAYKFRTRMQQEYSSQYNDAWVVQLKR